MILSIKELNKHFDEDKIKKDDLIDLCLSEYLKANNDAEKSDFLILIGRCFRAKKEPHYANEYLDKAINLKVKTAEALLWKGAIQNDLKNIESAISLLKKAIEADSSYEMPHLLLGIIYWRQNKFSETKNHSLKAIALNPESAKSHYWLSEALYSLKENDLSEFHLRKAISLGFDFAADTLQKRFKIKTAQEQSVYSDYFWNNFKRRRLNADLNKSLNQLRIIIKNGNVHGDIELSNYYTTLSERSLSLPRLSEEAINGIEKAIELSPDNAKAYFIWACLIEKTNTTDNEKIKDLYTKAIELDNTNHTFYSQFAKYESVSGNSEKAIQLYEKSQELFAYDFRTCEYLGTYYAENGQLEKGLELLRRAARYGSTLADSKLKALTIGKLTRPLQGASQEEREKYYLEMEISDLIKDAEYESSGSKWPAARFYFQIAKEKLEKEEKIIGGRLDRLLTDVYAKIGWCTAPPEGNDWLQKAINKDPLHLGASNILAARYLTSDPEKAKVIYTKIRALNPNDITSNYQLLVNAFKNKEYKEVVNLGPNVIRIIENEYDVLLRERKSYHTILKQMSDTRWYLAKSFEETGNYGKALEFFEKCHFHEDSYRVKQLIKAENMENNERIIGWNKMPEKYEIESMIAAYFKQFGSEEHKNIAQKVRIRDQNIWSLWKETKCNFEAPDEQIDYSFEGYVWKEDISWLNSIKLSNDFNWEDLDDLDEDEDGTEKVEVYTTFYVEVSFKDYKAGASIYLDFSVEGKEGDYYVECTNVKRH